MMNIKKLREKPGKKQIMIGAAILLVLAITAACLVLFTGGGLGRDIKRVQVGDRNYPEYQQDNKDRLVIGVGTLTGNYDPVRAVSQGDIAVTQIIFQSLIRVGPDGKPQTELASNYTVSNDGRTYTFTIPSNIMYSDGSLLELQDIEQVILSYAGEHFQTEESVIIEKQKISFTFETADYENIWTFLVGIKKPIEEDGEEKFLGTGAYQIDQNQSDASDVVLTRNEHYKGQKGKMESVKLVNADPGSLATMFASGMVDLAYFGYNQNGLQAAADNSYTDLYTTPGSYSYYMGMNMNHEALADLNVRLGLAHGINYNRVVAQYDGYAQINPSPFPGISWLSPEGMEPYRQDTEKALTYFKEAGYVPDSQGLLRKDGETLSFRLTTFMGQQSLDAVTGIKEDLGLLGIECEIIQLDYSEFYQQIYETKDFDLYYGNWSHGLTDNIMSRFGEPQPGVNAEGWYPEELASLVERLEGETKETSVRAIYHDIAQLYHREVPQIPLASPDSFVISSSGVSGYHLSPYVPPYWNLEKLIVKK